MLTHVQNQQLYQAVKKLNDKVVAESTMVITSDGDASSTGDDGRSNVTLNPETNDPASVTVLHKLGTPLDYTDLWNGMVPAANGAPPPLWGATFLSKSVLITRNELLTLLRTKLDMDPTWENISLLAQSVQIQCFGVAILKNGDHGYRKVVGVSGLSPRRDFMRLCGTVDNTALSVQVVCFIQASGLRQAGIPVPERLRVPKNNTCCDDRVTLAVVRWLSPDPRCLLRDTKYLPLCPPPFGANHALWTFSKTSTRRGYLSDRMFAGQLHLFPGSNRQTRRQNAAKLERARYDLIQLESIEHFMNCTLIDDDHDSILETVTLPFR